MYFGRILLGIPSPANHSNICRLFSMTGACEWWQNWPAMMPTDRPQTDTVVSSLESACCSWTPRTWPIERPSGQYLVMSVILGHNWIKLSSSIAVNCSMCVWDLRRVAAINDLYSWHDCHNNHITDNYLTENSWLTGHKKTRGLFQYWCRHMAVMAVNFTLDRMSNWTRYVAVASFIST